MSAFVFLIEQITRTNGPYLLCGLVILLQMRALIQSQQRLSISEFDLERELAVRQRARAVTLLLVAIELAAGLYAITNVVAPTIRQDRLINGNSSSAPVAGGPAPAFQTLPADAPTSVSNAGVPAAIDLGPSFQTWTAQPPGSSNLQPLYTPKPSNTPPGTIEPGAPAPIGCSDKATDNQANLLVPANGQIVFEALTIKGTAFATNFSRYKFELSGPSTGNTFSPYGGDHLTQLTTPGVLGELTFSQFSPGTYLFRLTVFDATNVLKASCLVTIHLQSRPPTPTPSQTPPPQPTSTP